MEEGPTPARSRTGASGSAPSSRRRVLRAGAAVGVGAGAALVLGLGADHGTTAGRTEIVYAMARPEPGSGPLRPRTKEVPTDWHESTLRAFEVLESLRETDLSALLGSFAVPGSYDDPQASIAVDAADESPRETLESLVGDLSLELDVLDGLPPNRRDRPTIDEAYRASDLDRRRVSGGFTCATDDSFGTLAPALFDERDDSRYFATSNHLYGDAGEKETEHEGEELSLPSDRSARTLGRVVRGYPSADVVRVDPVDGYRPMPEVARASPGTVIGQYTRTGLADLMARGERLEKLGAISDRTAGRIEGIDGTTCYTGEVCKRGQLKWGDERTMTDGDSGSVNFHADPENPDRYVLVGGINNARTWWPGADFTWGTAAHHLLDEYGLHF